MMMELGATPPMLGKETVNGVAPAGMGTEFPNGHATLMYPANGLPLATDSVKQTLAACGRRPNSPSVRIMPTRCLASREIRCSSPASS